MPFMNSWLFHWRNASYFSLVLILKYQSVLSAQSYSEKDNVSALLCLPTQQKSFLTQQTVIPEFLNLRLTKT